MVEEEDQEEEEDFFLCETRSVAPQNGLPVHCGEARAPPCSFRRRWHLRRPNRDVTLHRKRRKGRDSDTCNSTSLELVERRAAETVDSAPSQTAPPRPGHKVLRDGNRLAAENVVTYGKTASQRQRAT